MREKVKAVLSGNQYKEDIMSKMNWMKKEKGRYLCDKDITISLQLKARGKTEDKGKVICFAFRNDCWELVTENEYIQVGTYKNRLFIRQADKDTGYKISKNNNTCNNRYCKMPNVESLKDFIGDYDLKYDDFLEMYYVEKE